MKVAILWSELNGYTNACLRMLSQLPGVELFVADELPPKEAPFDPQQFDWMGERFSFMGDPDGRQILNRVRAFEPDILFVRSWHRDGYRHVLRHMRGIVPRVLVMDHQWLGTLKQRIGVIIAPWYIRPYYDYVFLPAERQAVFARRLGFPENQIWRGANCCDHEAFAEIYKNRVKNDQQPPSAFLYVGRLVAVKQVDVLVEGYRLYRQMMAEPWPLIACGTGPMQPLLEQQPGIVVEGFVQPSHLPSIFSRTGCLVLPSRFEPWGIVIHEATSAGLAIICTPTCGASDHLVQDRYNGFLVEPGNPAELALALARYSSLDPMQRATMAQKSHLLSLQLTPQQWAEHLLSRAAEAIARDSVQAIKATQAE